VFNTLVENLISLFETLYMWGFYTVDDAIRLTILRDEASAFVDDWRMHIANGRERNYYHWLAEEAYLQILKSGSVWKYASDVTESFVHVLKDCFARFTSRGGGGRSDWTEQALFRVCTKVLTRALSASEWVDLLSKHEQKKVIEYVINQALAKY
jgi:hypothetical protein